MTDRQLRAVVEGEGAEGPPVGDDQAWNILVQILLPMVFILTFIVLTSIQAYKERAEAYGEIVDGDDPIAAVRLREAVLELQLQRLLKAFGEVKARERAELKLAFFPSPDRIRRIGLIPADEAFRTLCEDSMKIFADRAGFAEGLYLGLLQGAGLVDTYAGPVRRWARANPSGAEKMVEGGKALEHLVAPSNRQQVHHLILDFLGGLEAEVVDLQVALVGATFDELLNEGGGDLDPESAELLSRLARQDLSGTQRETLALALYLRLVGRWRNTFAAAGYEFLPASWREIGA